MTLRQTLEEWRNDCFKGLNNPELSRECLERVSREITLVMSKYDLMKDYYKVNIEVVRKK